MKKNIIAITVLLLVLPIGMLFYKMQVLQLSLLPEMVDDVWNFHLSVKPRGEVRSFSFPIPKPGPGMKVSEERIRAKGIEVFIDSSSDSSLATWSSRENFSDRVSYSARIDLKPVS